MKIRCRVCRKYIPSDHKSYCSRTCYFRSDKRSPIVERLEQKCAYCGKIEFRVPCDISKYCSHSCYVMDRKGTPLTAKLDKKCLYCKKRFEVLFKERAKLYCSMVCYRASRKGQIRTKRTTRKCAKCDVVFQVPIPHPQKKYCTKECYRRSIVGRKHTEETKSKMSRSSKKAGVLRRLHKDPEFQRKRSLGLRMKPNAPETIMIKLLTDNYPGEYAYTGDGQFIIDGLCPDFTNINGQKKLIEVFGESFHDPNISPGIPYRATEKGRREVFAEFGYKLLVVWSKEIYRGGKEGKELLLEKLRNFHEDMCN